MRERIARAQLVARREKEEGSAGAVRDAKPAQRLHHRLHAVMVGRHGEHAKGTGLRALLFESLDADFKLQPLVNLPVLEVAELFVNVVDLASSRSNAPSTAVNLTSTSANFSSMSRRKSVISSCTLARCVPNAELTMSLIAFRSLLFICGKYTMRAQVRKTDHLDARLDGLDQSKCSVLGRARTLRRRAINVAI